MAVGRPEPGIPGKSLLAAYEPRFRAGLRLRPDQADDPSALGEALRKLEGPPRDLADCLLAGVGAGEAVPERFRAAIDAEGEALWQTAFLLPRAAPSPGSTIDPRFYSGFCRVNPALHRTRLFSHLHEEGEGPDHSPPSDGRWDAIIVAAALEADPPRLTRGGGLRKDDERRFLARLGPDGDRWSLALAVAMAIGLARPAANGLHGFPESKPRPLTDPASLLEEEGARGAAALLLRIIDRRWVRFQALQEELERRCPEVLAASVGMAWSQREAHWLLDAADVLHRVGVFDAERGSEGITRLRRATGSPARPPGFLLTPDREILVAPGDLPGPDYGRLCRMAPYVDGDVVCRHRLTREGIQADLATGYDDAADWLAARSRTGLASNVRSALSEWVLSASRFTLYSGVTVLEEPGGGFRVARGGVPAGAREIFYDSPPVASFTIREGVLQVPVGQDPLTVRALCNRLGEALPPTVAALGAPGEPAGPALWRWRLRPSPIPDPDHFLDQLRRYSDGDVPGDVEAAVHAAGGRSRCRVEPSVILHLPEPAALALQRDPVVGALLKRQVAPGAVVVRQDGLAQVLERLALLGFSVEDEP